MVRVVLIALLIGFLARALWRLLSGVVDGIAGDPRRVRERRSAVPMVRDPVCGTFVVPERAVTLAEGGRALHFCSTACRDKYRARTA